MAIATISRDDGVELAYEMLPGRAPVVVFLPGFASDMGGTKAMALHELCAEYGQAMLRLDYSGHGASQGTFTDGTIGRWSDDAALVVEAVAGDVPVILVGSSMGGWIALLLAQRLGETVDALLLIAPAPDFTAELIEPSLNAGQLAALARDGFFAPPSEYGPPVPITQALLEEGRRHLLLGAPIGLHCPVRILHGMADPDVPWQLSLRLVEKLESQDVDVCFIKDGDHRLSRPQDLARLKTTLERFLSQNGA